MPPLVLTSRKENRETPTGKNHSKMNGAWLSCQFEALLNDAKALQLRIPKVRKNPDLRRDENFWHPLDIWKNLKCNAVTGWVSEKQNPIAARKSVKQNLNVYPSGETPKTDDIREHESDKLRLPVDYFSIAVFDKAEWFVASLRAVCWCLLWGGGKIAGLTDEARVMFSSGCQTAALYMKVAALVALYTSTP